MTVVKSEHISRSQKLQILCFPTVIFFANLLMQVCYTRL